MRIKRELAWGDLVVCLLVCFLLLLLAAACCYLDIPTPDKIKRTEQTLALWRDKDRTQPEPNQQPARPTRLKIALSVFQSHYSHLDMDLRTRDNPRKSKIFLRGVYSSRLPNTPTTIDAG